MCCGALHPNLAVGSGLADENAPPPCLSDADGFRRLGRLSISLGSERSPAICLGLYRIIRETPTPMIALNLTGHSETAFDIWSLQTPPLLL